MLTVTEAAGMRLAQPLAQKGLADESAIRLVAGDQGLAIQAQSQRPGDEVTDHEGRTISLLDGPVAGGRKTHGGAGFSAALGVFSGDPAQRTQS